MTKLLVIIATLMLLSACEQQKQASAEVGAKAKQDIERVTNDMNKALELADEKMKNAENEAAPTDVEK